MEKQVFLYDSSNEGHVMNEALPEIEVDVMARSSHEHRTPLHDAAISGNTEVVRLLLDFLKEHRTSPRLAMATGGRGFPMHDGGGGSHASTGRLGGHPQEQNSLDSRERRAIGSGGGGARGVVTALGVDLSTLKGRTAFHEAARHQHYDAMELLLQAGADINAFMSMDLDPTVNTDLTALVQACLMDQPETVRFLLRHGAKDSRLKALTRSLKGSLSSIAGILLCYNNQVREVAADVARALSLSSTSENSKKVMSFLQLMWNSKNLKFIRKEWLDTVVCELPQQLDRTCAIAQVDISSNMITELPIELFKLPFLTTLDISRNSITELPCEEGKSNGGWKCSRLSVLEAVRNQLSALPLCLFQLGEVKEINASSNKVAVVPASVWSSPKLCKLYLSGNQLDEFPTSSHRCEDEPMWNVSETSSSFLPTSPAESAVSDSGYRSSQHIDSMSMELNSGGPTSPPPSTAGGSDKERRPSLFQLPYGPVNALSNLRTLERTAHTIQTHTMISRRLESFHDSNMEVEELDELEEAQLGEEEGEAFLLEVLDLSNNQLSTLPGGLSCLAPKLTKLNVSKNRIKSLGSINDYPLDLEFLDASYNDLHATIAPAASILDTRSHRPCARKQLSQNLVSGGRGDFSVSMVESSMIAGTPGTPGTPPYLGSTTGTPLHHQHTKLCSHRTHKNLRKLSTLKMNHNHLIDLQLFRSFNKNTTRTDLSTSLEDSTLPHAAEMSVGVVSPTTPPQPKENSNLSRSVNFIQRAHNLTSAKKSLPELSTQFEAESCPSSESSQEGSGSRGEG